MIFILLLFTGQSHGLGIARPASKSCICSPATDRCFAPIGGSVDKKLFDSFFPLANIFLECHFNAVEKDPFCYNRASFARNENKWFYLRRKNISSTENNVRPNRDDSDHTLSQEKFVLQNGASLIPSFESQSQNISSEFASGQFCHSIPSIADSQ
jgi:hypothetical protein